MADLNIGVRLRTRFHAIEKVPRVERRQLMIVVASQNLLGFGHFNFPGELSSLLRQDFVTFLGQVSGPEGAAQFDVAGGQHWVAAGFVHAEHGEATGWKLKRHFHRIGDRAVIVDCESTTHCRNNAGCCIARTPANCVEVMNAPVSHLRTVVLPPTKLVGRDVVLVRLWAAPAEPHLPVEMLGRRRGGAFADA